MTVAQLGLAVDSSDVVQATPALTKMTAAAEQAERAATGLASGTRLASSATAGLTAAEQGAAIATERATAMSRTHAAALQAEAAAARMTVNAQKQLGFQINDIVVSLASGMNPAMVALQQGSQIAQIGLKEVAGAAGNLLARFAPIGAVVGVIASGFAGLTTKINETAKTQVGFGDVFQATVQLAAEGIGRFFKPAIDRLGTWWQQFVDWFAPIFKGVGNTIINTFTTAFTIVKDTWSLLPEAFASIFTKAMNGAIDIVQNGINGIIGPINDLLAKVNLPGIGRADLSSFKGMPSNADEKLGGIINRDVASGMNADPLGGAFGAISDRAQKLQLEDIAEAAEKAAKGLKHANDNFNVFDKMLADVAPLLHDANDPLTDLQSNMDKLGALLAAGEISWQQYGEAVNKANLNAASGVLGAVGQITGALAGAFEDNKAFAVANAVINTAEGVTKALAQGGIFGFASAAAIGIAGAAQVASILSAQPGSGSVSSVNAGAGAAGSVAAQPSAPTTAVHIDLHSANPNSTYTYQQVEGLLAAIKDYAKDGSTIITIGQAA